ncbi:outer membrane protein [Hyphomicrobium sp. 99]|uniref:outer membrane protein n=1 Tax=Hyphomicrobium sp. 99 TaxID=1163419 RepID=UPI0005F77892|nr:outer membrane beta-barrel protein [Hyphomicrobium sp. 99]
MVEKIASLGLAVGAIWAIAAGPAAANDWNGPSIGIGGGYQMTNIDTTAFQFGGIGEARETSRGVPGAGGFFTLSAGYDRKLSGPLVVGVFVDYDFGDVDTHFTTTNFGLDGTLTLKNQLSAGGRIGYLASPSTLFFGTFGYAHADSSDRTTFGFDQTHGNFGEFNGYFLGGGVEALVYDNFSIKAEYRYTSYQSEVGDFNGIVGDSVKPQLQSVRLSLNYRFGDRKTDVVDNPAPSVTSNWTGPYLGIGGGYSIATNMLEFSDTDEFGTTVSRNPEGSQGGFISLSAGYDLQIRPRIVIGAFVDGDFSNLHHSEGVHFSDADSLDDETVRNDFKDFIMVGGRIGYLTTPDTLLFVSGGYANAGLGDTTVTCNCTDVLDFPQGRIIAGKRLSGAFIGGGIETKIWDALSLKAEYRYVDLANSNVTNFLDVDPEILETISSRMDPAVQMGRLSLNWRFNGGPRTEPLK